MENVLRDARIGLRLLGKHPGFTAIAVLTVALGIAATTTIFSVIYATFLEPLPYRDADRLVMVWTQQRGERMRLTPAEFVEWKRQATAFDDLNAWSWRPVTVSSGGGRPERMQIGPATPGFLPMLGYGHPLALGRNFLEEEGTPGKDRVVILTHRVWRDRFGSDPGVIGRHLTIDRIPHTIVGVLGAGPADENQNDLWVPLAFTPERLQDARFPLAVMGRLKAEVTLQQANANLQAVGRNVARTLPAAAADRTASVEPFRNNFLSADTKRGLWLLLGAVALVLLIACANVANLLLARGSARQRELALRMAVGASREQIIRQLLIESVVLAIAGGVLGVALAAGLVQVVIALMPPFMLPTEANIRLNVPVLLFTVAVSGVSGMLFGAAPAWHATRANASDVLKEGGRALGVGGHRLREILVVVEFALASVLLTCGGLTIHSLYTLANREPGFRPDHLLTFALPIEPDRFGDPAEVATFYEQLVDRLHAAPGVMSASVSTGMPIRGPGGGMPFQVASKPVPNPSQRPFAGFGMVSSTYFDTFGIRITRGRTFTDRDRRGGVPVAIVNETFVQRHLGGVDPLSERLVFEMPLPGGKGPGPSTEWQIVGVFADVQYAGDVNERRPEINVPFWQVPWPYATLAVRTAVEPSTVQQTIAGIVQSIDPELPLADIRTMEQVISASMVRDRFNTVLFGSFAMVGLALSAFGIYGVMSFVVAQRAHEIGLRMALGADRASILRRVVGEGMRTALVGTIAGSVAAFYAARMLRGIVSGVSGLDPVAFAVVLVTLLCAALLACLVPAVRAAAVDPMVVLRRA